MVSPDAHAQAKKSAGRVTRADVARVARVSEATVSYVLNNVSNQTISQATRDAVHRAADELGYRPNLAARNLAFGMSGVVLYVLPRVALGELSVQIAGELSTALARRGIIMSIQFDAEDPRGIVDALANLHPVAVCSALPLSGRAEAAIAAAGIPLLQFVGSGAQGVDELHRAVGEAQVAHVVERGHRRVAFASSDVERLSPLNELRLRAVRAACRARGLPAPLEGVMAVDGSNAAAVVGEWHGEGVSAVCAYNDEAALVVLHGVRRAGLDCPADIAVIGVDASPIGYVTEPALTSVGFDPQKLVRLSVAGLLAALGYETDTFARTDPVVSVVERAST